MPIREKDLNTLKLKKGNLTEELGMVVWDYVKPCTKEECIIANHCPYWQNNDRIFTCKVEATYLKSAMEPFQAMLEKSPDPFVMRWVGMHLIPLYHQLCKMEMYEIAVSDQSRVYADKAGKLSIHPVYREIREINREIFGLWKNANLLEFAKQSGFLSPKKMKSVKGIIEQGDADQGVPEFYEEMSGNNGAVDV